MHQQQVGISPDDCYYKFPHTLPRVMALTGCIVRKTDLNGIVIGKVIVMFVS
jgi:hypothetical protein